MATHPLEIVREKIDRYLGEIVTSYEKGADFYRFRYETTAVIVVPMLWAETHVMIRIAAMVLQDLDPQPKLWERIAQANNQYMVGKLCYWPDDRLLTLEYYIFGDYLDREELATALKLIAITADELDEKLQAEFGGKRFVDP